MAGRLFRREMNVLIYIATKVGVDCNVFIVNDVGAIISTKFHATIERVRTADQTEFFRAFFNPEEETVLKLSTFGKTPLSYKGETGRGFEYGILRPITMLILEHPDPRGEKRRRNAYERRPIGALEEFSQNKRRTLE